MSRSGAGLSFSLCRMPRQEDSLVCDLPGLELVQDQTGDNLVRPRRRD